MPRRSVKFEKFKREPEWPKKELRRLSATLKGKRNLPRLMLDGERKIFKRNSSSASPKSTAKHMKTPRTNRISVQMTKRRQPVDSHPLPDFIALFFRLHRILSL